MTKRRKTTTFGTSKTPTKDPSKEGYFSKGQWLCNCQPRLPAVQFQVKRDSPNKGRWFYTCQIDRTKGKTGEPERCDFFLWSDDARVREEGAVLGNSTTEPSATQSLRTPRKLVQTTLSARVEPREEGKRHWTHRTDITPIGELERTVGNGSQGDETPNGGETAKSSATMRATGSTGGSKTAASTQMPERDEEDELSPTFKKNSAGSTQPPGQQLQTPSAGTKRKREAISLMGSDDVDSDDLFSDMDSDEERQLADIAESSSHPGRTRDALATPAAQKSSDAVAGMPTPSLTGKSVRRVLFAEPEAGDSSNTAKRQRNDNAGAYTSVGEPRTPSSSQEGSRPSSQTTPGSGAGIGDITQEVMDLLQGQKIDEATTRKVRSALQRYSAKAKGLEKGRDASRQALKDKDVKIAKLQERVTNLEDGRRLEAEARKKWKGELMHTFTNM